MKKALLFLSAMLFCLSLSPSAQAGEAEERALFLSYLEDQAPSWHILGTDSFNSYAEKNDYGNEEWHITWGKNDLDGLLAADIRDYDQDGTQELLTVSWVHDLGELTGQLEIYEIENGSVKWQSSLSFTTGADMTPAYVMAGARVSAFTYDAGGTRYLCISKDTYYMGGETRLYFCRYDGTELIREEGYAIFHGSDETVSCYSSVYDNDLSSWKLFAQTDDDIIYGVTAEYQSKEFYDNIHSVEDEFVQVLASRGLKLNHFGGSFLNDLWTNPNNAPLDVLYEEITPICEINLFGDYHEGVTLYREDFTGLLDPFRNGQTPAGDEQRPSDDEDAPGMPVFSPFPDGYSSQERSDVIRTSRILEWKGMLYYSRDIDGVTSVVRRPVNGGSEEVFLNSYAWGLTGTDTLLYASGSGDPAMTGYTEDGAPVTSAGDGMDFYYNGTGYGSAYSACYTVDPDGGSREILYSRPSGEDLPNVYNLLGIYQGKVYFVSKDSDEHYDPVYNLYRIDAAAGGTPEFVVKLFEDPNYRPWYFRGGCAYGWQEDQICWIDLEAGSLDFLTPDAQSLSVMTMRDLMYTDVADNGFLIGDLLIYYAIDDTIRACNVSTGRVAIIVSPGQLPDGTPVHIIPLDVEGATRFYYLKEEGEAVSFCSRGFDGTDEVCYWSASY